MSQKSLKDFMGFFTWPLTTLYSLDPTFQVESKVDENEDNNITKLNGVCPMKKAVSSPEDSNGTKNNEEKKMDWIEQYRTYIL